MYVGTLGVGHNLKQQDFELAEGKDIHGYKLDQNASFSVRRPKPARGDAEEGEFLLIVRPVKSHYISSHGTAQHDAIATNKAGWTIQSQAFGAGDADN